MRAPMEVTRDMAARVDDSVLRKLLEEVTTGTLTPSAALERVLEYVDRARPRHAHDAATDRGLSLADAALGSEGLAVRDPLIRELARRVAEGRMTGDEAIPFVDALISSPRAQTHADPEAATLDARVGPFYDTATALAWLGVSSEALKELIEKGDVLVVMSADGFPLFPAFQFGQDAQPLPQLREVLAELDPGQVDPWGDAVWLNAPADELEGLSPATAQRLGRTEAVIRLARDAGSFRFG